MKQDEIIEMFEYLNAAYEGDDLYTGDQVRELMKLVAAKERKLFVETLSRLADSYRLADKQGSSDDICKIINYINEKGEA